MGLFGFGKKKTPAEILAEGRAQYVKGDLKKALQTFRNLAEKGEPQACCYTGKIYLEQKEKSLAQPFLTIAAKGGQIDAAQLLAKEFGVRDYLPKDAVPVSESLPETNQSSVPQTSADTVELYQKGKEAMRAKDWEGGIQYWTQAAQQGHGETLKELTQFYVSGYNHGFMKNKPSRAYIDYDKAIEWGIRAMAQGVDVASDLITAYEKKGQIEQAVKLGEQAVRQGMDAEWRLMYLHLNQGNYENAIFWGEEYDKKKGGTEAKQRLEEIQQEAFEKGVNAYQNKNLVDALDCFLAAAKQGHEKAQEYCGLLYNFGGDGINVDKYEALYWYEKAETACEKELKLSGTNIEYFSLLTEIYEPAIELCKAGKIEGLRILLKLAQKDILIAQVQCGKAFYYGLMPGVAEDKEKAFYWYEKAAKRDNGEAQFHCGLMYYNGEGVAEDKVKALYWFEKAAEKGDVDSQFNCGMMYDNGAGVAEDREKALYWFEKAAEQGHANAQFNCGNMYSNGKGTAVNKAKGLYWFEKAAEQGDDTAQFVCGLMYDGGMGTIADKTKALFWYEKAAEQGQVKAQLYCGVMYYNGDGTAIDKAKARMWLQKAAQSEDKRVPSVQEEAKKLLREYF